MAMKPILFSGPMISALLTGRKTQTRRIIKDTPEGFCMDRVGQTGWQWTAPEGAPRIPFAPPYAHGDLLWVREAWQTATAYDDIKPADMSGEEPILYAADDTVQTWGWENPCAWGRKRPGMFMPRWASRLTLAVTDVRVQRLHEISEGDAVAEGCEAERVGMAGMYSLGSRPRFQKTARDVFHSLWDSLNAKRGFGWDANPWVAAYSFTVHRCNVDQMAHEGRD